MTRSVLACLVSWLAGCSFIYDFDDFRIEKVNTTPDGSTQMDGSMPRDAGRDGGPSLVDCSTEQDGKVCGSDGDKLCIDRICRTSVCGDGYVDATKDEQCEDLNLVPGDGCEPGSCRYSCNEARDCDNAFVCDGAETCVNHGCTSAALDPSLTGMMCQRFDGVAGTCDTGYCIPEGCGDGVLDIDRQEECDSTNGCRPDCTMGCVSDAQCSDGNACNGIEDCDLMTGECEAGPIIPCVDQDACTADGACAPVSGCVFTLLDEDRDGYAPFMCADGSTRKGDDCDDTNPTIHPGATEYCDGLDNDCDDEVDENAVMATCYPDADGDGFPLKGEGQTACSCPKGTLPAREDGEWDCWDDASDAGRDVFPGQTMSFATGYDARCASPTGPCRVVTSFDYDCDGKETPYYTESNRTSCGALGGALSCSPSGYTGEAAACGTAAPYLTCRANGGLLGGCAASTRDLAQLCR